MSQDYTAFRNLKETGLISINGEEKEAGQSNLSEVKNDHYFQQQFILDRAYWNNWGQHGAEWHCIKPVNLQIWNKGKSGPALNMRSCSIQHIYTRKSQIS